MDVEAESIAGVAELMLTPPSDVLTEVTESGWTIALNCCEAYEDGSGLTVYQVTIDGAAVQFKVEVADHSVAPVSLDELGYPSRSWAPHSHGSPSRCSARGEIDRDGSCEDNGGSRQSHGSYKSDQSKLFSEWTDAKLEHLQESF